MHQGSCSVSNCLAVRLNKHLDLAVEGQLVGQAGHPKLRSQIEWGGGCWVKGRMGGGLG